MASQSPVTGSPQVDAAASQTANPPPTALPAAPAASPAATIAPQTTSPAPQEVSDAVPVVKGVIASVPDDSAARQQMTVEINGLKQQIDQELARQPGDISIVTFIDSIVAYASMSRASDIHFDPTADMIRVRFRIDGVLYDIFKLPKIMQSILVTRIKVLCGIRTDEHLTPQDGRFKTILKDVGAIDVRVSIVPTYYGENVEMRLLQTPSDSFRLQDLTLSPPDYKKMDEAIHKPYGMILATGPTGSGKTTMLYAILKDLNKPEVSILTIEDPIEYSIDGIQQIQVNSDAGLTFADGLRSFLRQDPNIIMVGEIRDEDTANISVNAALTGHLVLSTVHTNDAATTITRLLEFKIEPFLIASTVNVALGERLVRQICPYCKVTKTITDVEYQSLTESIPQQILGNHRQFYVGQGCAACGGTGYLSRIGIYEVLLVDDVVRELIMKRATSHDILAAAMQNGMTTMLQDGFDKAIKGMTTIAEVLRVVHE